MKYDLIDLAFGENVRKKALTGALASSILLAGCTSKYAIQPVMPQLDSEQNTSQVADNSQISLLSVLEKTTRTSDNGERFDSKCFEDKLKSRNVEYKITDGNYEIPLDTLTTSNTLTYFQVKNLAEVCGSTSIYSLSKSDA
jgi:hypothetical protein